MKSTESTIKKLLITDIPSLDPVKVFIENIAEGQGQITITCYGQAWTAYWGGMGPQALEEFFCSCNVSYIANKLTDEDPEVVDTEALNEMAEKNGIASYRDDPQNDYELLEKLFGSDMYDWYDSIPKRQNHKYAYVCRIIEAVQSALNEMRDAA